MLAKIYQELCWSQDEIMMFGKLVTIPRLQAWYADDELSYTYSKLQMKALPWLATLQGLRQQLEGFCQHSFNAVLANCYRDERDSVSWHSDDEKELGKQPVIASLSFGASREFHLKPILKLLQKA
jgi:alkylated DNA repair dioxygenase AlkB